MADKKLNEVQKVTDMAYVPVIMADGSVGQIAKADLATVVAGLMESEKLYPFMNLGILSRDPDDMYGTKEPSGIYYVNSAHGSKISVNGVGYGLLIALPFSFSAQVLFQTYPSLKGFYFRTRTESAWNSWVYVGE